MNRPEDVRWKFGSFWLDATQLLLFRHGELVPLSRKATEILKVLVECHGQLVAKEDLMRRVWPDSFVEESNLTVHIFQLRKTLGEDGGDYRIETIPRRGYRFIGVVESESPAAPVTPQSESSSPPLGNVPSEDTSGKADAHSSPPKASIPGLPLWASVLAGTALVVALFFVGLRFRNKAQPIPAANPASGPTTEKDRILLGAISNNTGEPVFDTTLREAIAIELEQSPYLSLISDEHMQQSLRLMGKPATTPLTPDLSRELCQRNGGAAVLDGWIAKLGTQYVLGVRALNCRTGDHISDLQNTVANKELVLKALGDMTRQLRAKLGESLSTVQKFDTPIEEATTSSLEALQAYSIGRQTMVQKGESAGSVPFFQQAVHLDPNFAIAYAALGNAYSNLGETGLAATNVRKAYQLRANVSEHEKLYIESHYYEFVTGDLIKASQVYELWAATYPNDEAPRTNLAEIYSNLGKFDRSLELAKEAVRIASHDGQSYANLVDAYISQNNPDQANSIAQRAISQNLDSSQLRLYLYDAAFLQHNSDAMQQQLTWASGEPGVEDAFIDDQANNLAASGQLAGAKELTARAAEAAKRADEKETAAGYETEEAQREAEFGNDIEARRAAEIALSLAKDRDTQYAAAVALALGGATDRAKALANALDKDFPDDTFVQYLYLPTIRGAIAVEQKDPERAIRSLEAARPYEFGVVGGLLPVYVRGLAYLEINDGQKAAAEFQQIIDHPGVVLNASIGPLARLQLGRALLMEGKPGPAKAAYDDFLDRWKNADPDIPILRDAKAEYAKQWTSQLAQH
jgi:DNA-binding winged helix-turn-helix (wHTH) protein/predicted Zn-dependent protease